MHNVYTLRGAKVRDASNWSRVIGESIDLFGEAEVYLASHHWPIWGNERIIKFLKDQRDIYKYLHDQTARLFNLGLTPGEIAEQLELPDSLRRSFHNRGYYGTVRHNARAVYQYYLGWYDGNPANLNPLPPVEAGKRYVASMGGAASVIDQAQTAFDAGDYRWVAELLNHLVFAEPEQHEARALLAMTYDQLGYQAESGPWRDVYLTAAYELRHGPAEVGLNISTMEDILKRTPVERFFDSLAARLNGPDAADEKASIIIEFTDRGSSYLLELENGVLHHRPAGPDNKADVRLKLTLSLVDFFSLFDAPKGRFNIVTP